MRRLLLPCKLPHNDYTQRYACSLRIPLADKQHLCHNIKALIYGGVLVSTGSLGLGKRVEDSRWPL